MIYVALYCLLGMIIPAALYCGGFCGRNRLGFSRRNQVGFVLLATALLATALVRGLAYDTGVDYLHYWDYYTSVFRGDYDYWGEHTEVGYRVFVSLLTKVSPDPRLFFVLSSLLMMGAVVFVSSCFRRAAVYILLVWPIFMFTLSMNLYRQYIAISFVMIAVACVIRRSWWGALLFYVLGVLSHASALIMLPILIFYHTSRRVVVNKYILVVLVVGTTVLADRLIAVMAYLVGVFQFAFGVFNNNEYTEELIAGTLYDVTCVRYVAMATYVVWVCCASGVARRYKAFRPIYYASAIAFIMAPISQQEILSRVHLYFMAFEPIFLGVLIIFYRKTVLGCALIVLPLLFHLARYVYCLYLLGADFPLSYVCP